MLFVCLMFEKEKMMDVSDIRLKNYKLLLQEFQERPDQVGELHHGLLRRFATHTGLSDRYLSHINNGRKAIGGLVARKLEEGMGKSHGWLDNDHDAPMQSQSDIEKELVATVISLFREFPDDLQQVLMRFMREKITSKK